MRTRKSKATTLYETRLSPAWIAKTVIYYLIAAIVWYILCVITPYMDSVSVAAADKEKLTRAAFTATAEELSRPNDEKPRALFMPTSEESFARRLRLVESAQKTIDFMVYDIYEDAGAQYFFTALFRAADRGVKVRIITDGKLGDFKAPYLPLRDIIYNHNNIEAYGFNNINFGRPQGLMTLLHDKVIVVDGDTAIVGGANMGFAAYLNNYDAEVLITNAAKSGVAEQIKGYYERMLSSKFTERRKRSKKVDETAKATYEREFEEYMNGQNDGGESADETGVVVDKVTHVTNEITDGKKSPIILQAIFNLAESSERTTIVTPYTLLTEKKIWNLRRIAAKNKSFRLITNSLYNSRNMAYAQYYYSRKNFLTEDIELWEYQADDQLHAKFSVYDGRYTVIGSFNLDERSAHIDTESVVVIDSAEFAATVERYIEEKFLSNSCRVGMNNRYIASDVAPGSVPTSKKVKYFFYASTAALINLL